MGAGIISKGIRAALLTIALLAVSTAATAQGNTWKPVTGAADLKAFMSGRTLSWKEAGSDVGRGEYRADGTGTLHAWGATFPRKWEVKGNDQICVSGEPSSQCYNLEKSSADPALYRATDVATGTAVEMRITGTDGEAVVKADPEAPTGKGGPAKASASEMAAELSNPNTALASLNFKNQFRWFEGDLPNADDQSSYTLLFQPVLPFPLEEKGRSILFRPAIPLLVSQPVFNAEKLDFDQETALGDIAFDLAYAMSSKSGLLTAFGVFATIPTATSSDLGSGRWSAGPEFLIAKKDPKYVAGFFPSHLWDYAGWTDKDVNVTNLKLIATWLPGGGYSIGSNPAIKYNWESEQWTVPLNLMISKTVITKSGRPWKLAVEVDYFIEKADAFAPKVMLSFNVTPVVKNVLADLFK